MLKFIECEKFIENGLPRGRIEFFPGLNICLGEDNAENSIGKSTLLFAVDFCFGGDSYCSQKGFLEKAGNHKINFCLEFGKEPYYFSRSTENPKEIALCDEDFNITKKIRDDEFKKFLLEKYNLTETGLSFRQVVTSFIRIFGKESSEIKNIVGVEGHNGGKTGILRNLIKLFEKYDEVKTLEEKSAAIQSEQNEFTSVERSKIVKNGKIKNLFQLKESESKLDQLNEELSQIAESNKIQTETVDAQRAAQAAELEKQITVLRRNRTKLLNEKSILETNFGSETKIQKEDFDELKSFFLNINIPHIEEIQNFHKQISKILKKETEEELAKIEDKISENENNLIEATQELTELSVPLSIPKKVLEQYASVSIRKNELEEQVGFYKNSEQISRKLKEIKIELDDKKFSILKEIAVKINQKLEELNGKVNGNDSYSPRLNLNSSSSYSFYAPNDNGTGTAYVSMILYDLAILELTNLPFLIHDSVLFKNLSDNRVIKVFEEYENSRKQIFVSFDKKNSYGSDELKKTIDNHTVIKLYAGGGELFGCSWAKKKNSN
ncbi:DUF2326 domain-containing protein [Treponema succinifaciens]|uniref:DUF2326 domain-containing protein n=1 Tax=Treponema succinifaciens TaxID=167 RepID=UPI003F7EAC94